MDESGDLIIRHVLASDAGKYQCVATNMAASRETPAVSLNVYGKISTRRGDALFSRGRARPPTLDFPPPRGLFMMNAPGGRENERARETFDPLHDYRKGAIENLVFT